MAMMAATAREKDFMFALQKIVKMAKNNNFKNESYNDIKNVKSPASCD